MPIQFRCTICQRLLRVPDGVSGQQARCPGCGAVVTVPSIDDAPEADLSGAPSSPFASSEAMADGAAPPSDAAGPAVPDDTPPDAPTDRRNDASMPETLWAPSPSSPFAPRESAAGGSPFAGGATGPFDRGSAASSAGGAADGPPISENPYASPSTDAMASRPIIDDVYAYAAMRVQTPAVGLIVTGSLGLVGTLPAAVASIVGAFGPGRADPGEFFFTVGAMLGSIVIAGAISVLLILGGLKMKRLENYNLAMAASIVAMLPIFGCWGFGCGFSVCLGLVFGIWGVVTLSDARVRAAFDQTARVAAATSIPPAER